MSFEGGSGIFVEEEELRLPQGPVRMPLWNWVPKHHAMHGFRPLVPNWHSSWILWVCNSHGLYKASEDVGSNSPTGPEHASSPHLRPLIRKEPYLAWTLEALSSNKEYVQASRDVIKQMSTGVIIIIKIRIRITTI